MTRLKKLRFLNEISQFKLANMARVHQSRISLFENGLIDLGEDEKTRLASALGVTVEEIFGDGKIFGSGEKERG